MLGQGSSKAVTPREAARIDRISLYEKGENPILRGNLGPVRGRHDAGRGVAVGSRSGQGCY